MNFQLIWLTFRTHLVLGFKTNCVVGGYSVITTECLNQTGQWEIIPALQLSSSIYPYGLAGSSPIILESLSCIAGGGYISTTLTPSPYVWCTNGSTLGDVSSSWMLMTSLNHPRSETATLYGHDWVGVISGYGSSGWETAFTNMSTTSALAWTDRSEAPLGRLMCSVPIILNGTYCLAGGSYDDASPLTTSLCLTGDLGVVTGTGGGAPLQWVPGPGLTTPRWGSLQLEFPDRWCVVGGRTNSNKILLSNTLECINKSSTITGNFTPLFPSVPVQVGFGANFTFQGLPCFTSGCYASTPSVWCANLSSDGHSVQWLSIQSQTLVRCAPTSFTIDHDLPDSRLTLSAPSSLTYPNTLRLLAVIDKSISASSQSWSSNPPLENSNDPVCVLPTWTNSPTHARARSLPENCLAPGRTYRFTFTVQTSNTSLRSWIFVHVLNPPTGGTCTISPLIGEALTTPFNVSCQGWVDPERGTVVYTLFNSNGSKNELTATQPSSNFVLILESSSSSSSTLQVDIQGGGGTTSILLPPITVNPPPNACPLDIIGINSSLTVLKCAFSQFHSAPTPTCSFATVNSSWILLWQAIQQLIIIIQPDELLSLPFVLSSLETAMWTMPTPTLPSPTSVLTVMEWFANHALSLSSSLTSRLLLLSPELFSTMKGNCSNNDRLNAVLAEIVRGSTTGHLPSDPVFTVLDNASPSSSSISLSSTFLFSDGDGTNDTPTIATLGGVILNASSSLLDNAGLISTITVTNYGTSRNSDGGCRLSQSNWVVVSPILDITLSNYQGDVVSVNQTRNFSFTIPVSGDVSCGVLQCTWWDDGAQDWSGIGCVMSETSNPLVRLCTCNHLTEFSLLLNPGCVSTPYRVLYYILLGGYSIVLIIIIIKFLLRQYSRQSKDGYRIDINTMLWQHFMLAVLAISRVATCALLATNNRQKWSLVARMTILLLPYMLQFWIYTLIVFQWASIWHFGFTTQVPFSRLRIVFGLSNIILVGCILSTIISVSLVDKKNVERAEMIIAISSEIIAGVTASTAISFLIYAILLFKGLKISYKNTTTQTRAITGAVVLCILLMVQAVMLISAILPRMGAPAQQVDGDASEVVLLTANLACIVAILVLYHRSMHSKPGFQASSVEIR